MPMLDAMSGTPEWHAARRGCATASRMKDVLAVSKKDGKPLQARIDYCHELVAERMTGLAAQHFVTGAMQWGTDQEPYAVEAYEVHSGVICRPSGFYRHDEIEFFGASPDREIEHDGLLEVKCPSTTTFIRWLRDGVVPQEHIPQMLAQLAVTRRKWVEFVAFDPRIQAGPQLFIRRFEPAAADILVIEEEASKFLAEVDAIFDLVTQQAA